MEIFPEKRGVFGIMRIVAIDTVGLLDRESQMDLLDI